MNTTPRSLLVLAFAIALGAPACTTSSTPAPDALAPDATVADVPAPDDADTPDGAAAPDAPDALEDPNDPSAFHDRSETLPMPSRTGRTMEARAADFDGDGDLDLILAKEFRANALLLNDGAGRFTDASSRIPRAVHDHEDIAVLDVDGDRDLDIVVASEDDSAKELYLNDGAANFTDASARLPQTCQSNAVAAGDIDRDGDPDLVFGCVGAELVLLNDGAGNFTDESARIPAATDTTQDVALGDIDGDGDLDLVAGNEDGNRLYLNDGAGRFTDVTQERLPAPAFPEETRNADLGDVDGDGDLDLVFSNVAFIRGRHPQDRLLINDGAGRFTDETAQRLPVERGLTMDTDLVDIDRDGDRDLVQAFVPEGSMFAVLRNDGTGRFTDATEELLPASAVGEGVEVEAADYNGDGRVDLYLTGFRNPDLLLLAR